MQEIDMDMLKSVVKVNVIEMDEPCIIIGPSGAGKTEGIEQAVAEVPGARLCKFLLGQYDSVDFKGTPWVRTHDNGHQDTVWHPASTLPFKGNPLFDGDDDKPIVIFFDEATSATVPVLGIMYQLVQERRVGEHELRDNVRIILAGNRVSDKGIVNRFPMPLCNRLTWFEMIPAIKPFSLYAQRVGLPSICVAFLNWQKTKLHTFSPEKPEQVFATPRSWVKAMKYYASTTMSAALKEASISGAIGAGVCAEFYAFIKNWDTISSIMPDILKRPYKAEIPKELSMQYAIALSISGSMENNKALDAYTTYLMRMSTEFYVLAWQLAIARDEKLHNTAAFIKFAKANIDIW